VAVVKPEEIVIQQRLTKPIPGSDRPVSKLAYFAYAFYSSRLRDDYGRFLYNARTATSKLAEQRPDITEAEVWKTLEEYRAAGLLRTWEADGRTWAEWAKAVRTGNRFHGTPEPPPVENSGSPQAAEDYAIHVHNASCLRTAIRQARGVGDLAEAERLSRQLKGLESVDAGQQLELGAEQRAGLERQPSSSTSAITTTPLPPPARAGGGMSRSEATKAADRCAAYARELGLDRGHAGAANSREDLAHWRKQFRTGLAEEQMRDALYKRALEAAQQWLEWQGGGSRAAAERLAEWIRGNRAPGELVVDTCARWLELEPTVPKLVPTLVLSELVQLLEGLDRAPPADRGVA
jgi:hypothetical protein